MLASKDLIVEYSLYTQRYGGRAVSKSDLDETSLPEVAQAYAARISSLISVAEQNRQYRDTLRRAGALSKKAADM